MPPLFRRAVQTLQHYRALDKAVFLTPYEPIFHRLRHEAQRWHQQTRTPVAIAYDTEGPQLFQLSAWPSAVHRNQQAGARFALWGAPVVTHPVLDGFCRGRTPTARCGQRHAPTSGASALYCLDYQRYAATSVPWSALGSTGS